MIGLTTRSSRFGNGRAAGIVLAGLLCIVQTLAADAAEPWADKKLPVTEGLELWLDGAHAAGAKAAEPDRGLSQWLDASGNGRNLQTTTSVP
jgi:hypothetical protein